jgi:IclR family acetate operon transcriptional repressor
MASVSTLQRGLAILDYIVRLDHPVRLSEVVAEFRIDRAMTYRFLQTLCEFGLLHQDAKSKRYAPGGHFYGWMLRARHQLGIVDVARPYLEEVAKQTGQSAHLGMLVDDAVLLVDFVPSENLISVNNRVGVLEPLYCTAIGKSIAMSAAPEALEGLLDAIEIVRHTDRTITDRSKLKRHLVESAKRGYAFDDGEFNELLACVAVPLKGPAALPPLSMGVSMLRPVVASNRGMVESVARELVAAGRRLERRLLTQS